MDSDSECSVPSDNGIKKEFSSDSDSSDYDINSDFDSSETDLDYSPEENNDSGTTDTEYSTIDEENSTTDTASEVGEEEEEVVPCGSRVYGSGLASSSSPDPVNTLSTDETYVSRFRLYGTRTTFKFNNVPENVPEIDWIRRGFQNIVNEMKKKAAENDYMGFTLTSQNLKNKERGYIAYRPVSQVTGDILWEIFGGILQSNGDAVKSTDTFTVECTRVNLPTGGSRRRAHYYDTFENECHDRRSIAQIKNSDNLCLPRALVVGRVYAQYQKAKKQERNIKHFEKKYKEIREDKKKRQKLKAKKLLAKTRLNIPEEGAGINELDRLQDYLKNKYIITVYNFNARGREVYFSGGDSEDKMKINVMFHNGHYNLITSLTGAFSCSYYCEPCHTPYEVVGEHRCSNICTACCVITPPCKVGERGLLLCTECNRHFKNQSCFSAHKVKVCKHLKKCLNCDRLVGRRKKPHKCNEVYCRVCKDFEDAGHMCYMKKDERQPPKKDFVFIFFDFETRQEDYLESEDPAQGKVHKVNLCVSQQYCWECIQGDEACHNCISNRERVFKENPVQHFMTYVLELRKKFKDVCILAHNGQGFDFQFILKYVLENTKHSPVVIQRGTKIIMLAMQNVRFIDSLSYFPMALSALPKAFSLGEELKKGYFPHLFNTLANQNYVGPLPSKDYYCPDSMFEKNYQTFQKWYTEECGKDVVFDFQKEILEYCLSDVDILAKACIKFRGLFISECNVDPFLEASTIASACNLIFRRNFLRENTIGIIPKKGYRLVDTQSGIALQWLTWQEETRGVTIQHSGRGREIKIEGIKVDGFDGTRVYQFQGCYYHGCPKCFPFKRDEPLVEDPSDTLNSRYERTKRTTSKLEESEYEVIEEWECDFKALKKREKLNHLDNLPILSILPLQPRDAFFGGRTGNTKTFYKCEENVEEIRYIDVCSLYPYVNKYGKYPVGHPKIHVGNRECSKLGMNVEGLMKCKILPPFDLYHPVLPTRMNDKLMFLLCRECGTTQMKGDCCHGSEERALTGTWTMDEIRKAVSKGYTILDMYELWEYETITYTDGGLFTEFINTFLRVKQESSGYPDHCDTPEAKEKYIEDYFTREGIKLDPAKIEKNAGLRSMAKQNLVSFWGKFAERENQAKTTVVRSPQEFFKMMTSPEVQVNNVRIINEEVILVNWEYLDHVSESKNTVNIVLAAYTTAQARLKLYDYLDRLGDKVLYYDTDSVIYVQNEGTPSIETGVYLGDMTCEITGEYGAGSYIAEFLAAGPKSYAFKVYSAKEEKYDYVCKVKGLTLNHKTSQVLNYEKFKEMILNGDGVEEPEEGKNYLNIKENRIRRTRDRNVITIEESKIFKITGPKRKMNGPHDTLPYGFKKQKT